MSFRACEESLPLVRKDSGDSSQARNDNNGRTIMNTNGTTFSRRGFLKTAAISAAGVALGRVQVFAADAKPYGPFKMGVQSYSLRHFDLDGCLERTQKLRLHYIEAFGGHSGLTTD